MGLLGKQSGYNRWDGKELKAFTTTLSLGGYWV